MVLKLKNFFVETNSRFLNLKSQSTQKKRKKKKKNTKNYFFISTISNSLE